MALLKTLITGIVAGVTAFFPVSSTGSVMVCAHLTGVQMDGRLFRFIMLGVFLAMLLSFFRDLVRLVYSFGGILKDLFYNLKVYLQVRGRRSYDYRRILTGNYRNLLVLLLIALIPAVVIGAAAARLVRYACGSTLTIGLGFFVTAVILLVSSYMVIPEKGPKLMKPYEALIIGAFQGLAFMPGISKTGTISSAGFLCGVSRKLAVKFSYLLGMISLLMIILSDGLRPASAGTASAGAASCIAGFAGAFVPAMLLLGPAERMISKENHRIFAGFNVILGMAALLIQVLAHR